MGGTVSALGALPTLPSFPAVDDLSERGELMAALAFVESAASWSAADVARWFATHAELLGRDKPPATLLSSGAGEPPRSVRPEHLPRQLAMVRWQVILTLRGLLSRPVDDRFLNAAIFSERVRRHQGVWRVEARAGDNLADVVLALFTVDVLTHRDFHDQRLCVCDVCGRISYNPAVTTRAGCPDHVPATEVSSGVQERKTDRRRS
jgi:hypothetical protein